MDRRKRKSRQAILDACIALTKEKPFQQITVHEIVERADLNRGTFYLHFVDKFEMMQSFQQEMLDKIEQVLLSNIPEELSVEVFIQSRQKTIVQIFECYEENKELLQFIMKSGDTSFFQEQLCGKMKMIMEDHVFPLINVDALKIPTDLVALIFTSISLSLVQYAYKAEGPIDVEANTQFLINSMLHGPLKTIGFLPESFGLKG